MTARAYYSARTGRNPRGTNVDLPLLRELFREHFKYFESKGYFQEALGTWCVDSPDRLAGSVGSNIAGFFFRKLRKANLWPLEEKVAEYTEDDVFDVIELLHDLVSKPIHGSYHQFNDCGWHYDAFEPIQGKAEFYMEMNALLKDYGPGYEISAAGVIMERGDPRLQELLEIDMSGIEEPDVASRVSAAVGKFRRRNGSLVDRRDAVRDLVDVLEFLRPRLSSVLTRKDESDLFNIANNFGLRHHNEKQRTDYDQEVWLETLFYHYLNLIRTVLRLLATLESAL